MLELNTNFVIKNPPLEESQDYVLLRQKGIEHIEKLAHQIWTDYNVHDSGITILELLCYAISDLGYRTGFDIKDLLTEEKNGEPFIDSTAFHTAKDIFPSSPVTFDDLRKILIDITGVKQAWVGKNENVFYHLDVSKKRLIYNQDEPEDIPCDPLNGLFNVLIQREDFVENDHRNIQLFGEEDMDNFDAFGNDDPTLLKYLSPTNQGIKFKVRYPITLQGLTFYTKFIDNNLPADFTIRFSKKDSNGTFQKVFTRTIDLAEEPVGLVYNYELEEELSTGDWRLTIKGNNVEIGFSTASNYPYGFIGVMELLEGFDDGGINHYFAFQWQFTYAVSPVLQETLSIAPIQNSTVGAENIDATGTHLSINNKGIVFNVFCPITLDSISVNADVIGAIKISLFDRDGILIASKEVNISTTNTLVLIDLDWKISAGLYYSIKAFKIGSNTTKLYRDNVITFPLENSNVVEMVGGTNNGNTNSVYYFFYDWKISYQPCLPQVSEITLGDIRKAVKDKLYIHRNLCEDFMNIQVLKTEEISVCMDLEVRPDVDLEETLAEIYYQLELYVSPPVNFYSIQELLDKGKTTDQIFEGPLLDHGFIDQEEFIRLNRRDCLRTSDVIQIIMNVEGVTAVKTISLLSFVKIEEGDIQLGDTIHREINEQNEEEIFRVQQEDWILKLQDINFFAPDFSPTKSKTFFYKNNLPYLANRAVVADLLAEKRAQQIRSKLRGHQIDLPVPVGTFRDLEDYYPIQNDLPETYFTGQNLVPESRSNLRKAQSNQLKGYLLFFEQILANYLSQLGHIKHLFSWKKDAASQSYFTQKLKEIANVEGLYIDDYNVSLDNSLSDIIETDELAGERKNRLLNHLIGRFSEQLTEYGLMMHSLLKDEAAERLIVDKQALLNDYPRVSRERGKGFDYRFPKEFDNLTGFQRRVYRLLGIYQKEDCKVGRWNFSSPNIRIISKTVVVDGQPKKLYFFRILTEAATADVVEQEALGLVVDYALYDFVFESNCCESRQQTCILIDALISFGANEKNWCKIDNNPFTAGIDPTWVLKRTCITCEKLLEWTNSGNTQLIDKAKEEILGFTSPLITSEEDLKELVIGHFSTYANREGFHVIENILLRKRTVESQDDFLPIEIHSEEEDCQCVEVKDPYSFRASVILPSWPIRFRSTRFRQLIEKTLRLEAPAHIYLRICWINHCEMQMFENCHDTWLEAHADLNCKFRGERELPKIVQPDPDKDILSPEEKVTLEDYRKKLKDFIDKLYDLNNVFTVARLHGCDDVDSDEPQVSLNNTSLGSV